MPFYKKFQEFKFAFTQGNLQTFNAMENLELLISVDSPLESDLLVFYLQQLIQSNQLRFSVKVLLNEQDHPWRCPTVAINVGIRHAYYDKILVLSPETIPLDQAIEMLVKKTNSEQFALGIVQHVKAEQIQAVGSKEAFMSKRAALLPYGSICFTKDQANKVGGYDESYQIWGGDDDDYRARLMAAGFLKIQTLAKFLHSKFHDRLINHADNQEERKQEKVIEKIKFIKEKSTFVANNGNYGMSFSKVIFNFVYHHTHAEMIET